MPLPPCEQADKAAVQIAILKYLMTSILVAKNCYVEESQSLGSLFDAILLTAIPITTPTMTPIIA